MKRVSSSAGMPARPRDALPDNARIITVSA
jgi:hypothetical protein